jgi:hypothetical protein
MKRFLIIALALLLGAYSTTASAVEVTRFGPKQYVCEKGKPQTVTDTFPADPGRGWVIVKNGDENGRREVSSAAIILNGKRVFAPWTFNHHHHYKDHIHLLASNTLSVKVHGRPGSYLTIWVMQEVPIELTITSPENGATVSGPFIRVEGTVVHPLGHETGVIIYPHHKGEIPLLPPHGRADEKKHHHPLHSKDSYLGIAAMVYGNQFVASHCPVQEGRNILTVIATDTDGNVAAASIKVNVVIPANYIRITADTEMGISPLETTLRIEGTFSFAQDPVLSYAGPGDAQVVENPSPTEYRMRMTTAGIYTFMAQAKDTQGNTYTDTVTITVLTKEELDALLQARWEGMKSAIANQDVRKALTYFAADTQGLYRDIYTALDNNLSQIAQDMQNIQFIYAEGRIAKYRIRKNEEYGGQVYPITYYIYFVRDQDGLWKIYRY